jgi:hypothetical protein
MHLSIVACLVLFLEQALALGPCRVNSHNDSLVDDVPNIAAALQKCGDSGTVLLPTGQTFNVRTPLDLSPCKRCNFMINGELNISTDWDYWQKQPSVFKLSGAANAIISSDDVGIIHANAFGWTGSEEAVPVHVMPKLFSISDESSQIYIRDLEIRSDPGTVFDIRSGTSAVHFSNIEIESGATTVFMIQDAQHVYIYECFLRAFRNCVVIAPNTTNVQLQDSTCSTYDPNTPSTGVELRLSGGIGTNWIRNILVRNLKALGWMNVVAIEAPEDGVQPKLVQMRNVTFDNVAFGAAAHQAVFVGSHTTALSATDFLFRNFTGQPQLAGNLTCPNAGDVCEFKQQGWSITVSESK